MSRSSNRVAIRRHSFDRPSPVQTGAFCGNLGSNAYWQNFPFYTNALRDAYGFAGRSYSGAAHTDASGWPTDDTWENVLSCDTAGVPGILDIGDYFCEYKTSPGVVSAVTSSNNCSIVDERTLADGITHRFTLRVTGFLPIIKGTGGVGLRDMVIPQRGYDLTNWNTRVFMPSLVRYLRNFGGLRLMDLMATNYGSKWSDWQGQWANAPWSWKMQSGTIAPPESNMSKLSMPYDLLVRLVNEVANEPGSQLKKAWFNIPHMATDDFITQFLTYIHANLDPKITPYFEWSNETWNYTFPQAVYTFSQSGGQEAMNKNIRYDGYTDANALRARVNAMRSLVIAQTAKSIWAQTPQLPQPKCMLCYMFVNSGYYTDMLKYVEWFTNNPASTYFDAICIAPYFGPSNYVDQSVSAGKTATQMGDLCVANYQQYGDWESYQYGRFPGGIKHIRDIANDFGVRLVAYEGGWDYSQMSQSDVPEMVKLLRSPRWREICRDYMAYDFKCGVEEFFWFTINVAEWASTGTYSMFNFQLNENTRTTGQALAGFQDFMYGKGIDISEVNAHGAVSSVLNTTSEWFPRVPMRADSVTGHGWYFDADTMSPTFRRFGSVSEDVPKISMRLPFFTQEAGTYKFVMTGYGGTALKFGGNNYQSSTSNQGFILDAYGNRIQDVVADGGLHYNIYTYQRGEAPRFLGRFEPPLGGNGSLYKLSNTVKAFSMPAGYSTIIIEAEIDYPCPTVVTYRTDEAGVRLLDTLGNPIQLSVTPGSATVAFSKFDIKRVENFVEQPPAPAVFAVRAYPDYTSFPAIPYGQSWSVTSELTCVSGSGDITSVGFLSGNANWSGHSSVATHSFSAVGESLPITFTLTNNDPAGTQTTGSFRVYFSNGTYQLMSWVGKAY